MRKHGGLFVLTAVDREGHLQRSTLSHFGDVPFREPDAISDRDVLDTVAPDGNLGRWLVVTLLELFPNSAFCA